MTGGIVAQNGHSKSENSTIVTAAASGPFWVMLIPGSVATARALDTAGDCAAARTDAVATMSPTAAQRTESRDELLANTMNDYSAAQLARIDFTCASEGRTPLNRHSIVLSRTPNAIGTPDIFNAVKAFPV
jgi:hypothetical protein